MPNNYEKLDRAVAVVAQTPPILARITGAAGTGFGNSTLASRAIEAAVVAAEQGWKPGDSLPEKVDLFFKLGVPMTDSTRTIGAILVGITIAGDVARGVRGQFPDLRYITIASRLVQGGAVFLAPAILERLASSPDTVSAWQLYGVLPIAALSLISSLVELARLGAGVVRWRNQGK